MKKTVIAVVMMMLILLVACVQEQTTVPETGLPKVVALSELGGHYTAEDYTDYGLWLLTIEAQALTGSVAEADAYYLETEGGVYAVQRNPLNTQQLMVFLPEHFAIESLSKARITTEKIKQQGSREDNGDIFIESVYLTKDGKDYELTMEDYLFMKMAPNEFVYADGKLIRPSYVKSSDGYVYTMQRYYNARQASASHDVNGAFTFLKQRSNNEELVYAENPYRVKIENDAVVTYDPDERDRVWQLGSMGTLESGSGNTYNIEADNEAQTLTLMIQENNLPDKYNKSGSYEIQFKGDATVCSFQTLESGLYRCIIGYAITDSVDLVKNARFSEAMEDGTAEHPFRIDSIEELAKVGSGTDGWDLKKCYRLTRDLDFNEDASYENPGANKATYTTGEGWMPIGNGSSFEGEFDGDGHSIRHLMINRSGGGYYGLFGTVFGQGEPAAKVMNLKLEDPTITSTSSAAAGPLIGGMIHTEVTNCSASNVNINCRGTVGGLIGLTTSGGANPYSTITYCWASGVVTSYYDCGGLVGWVNYTTVQGCYADVTLHGNINGSGKASPFIGSAILDSVIKNCYSLGDCEHKWGPVGGIVGFGTNSTVFNTYAAGDLTILEPNSSTWCGGLIGALARNSSPGPDPSLSDSIAFNSQITGGVDTATPTIVNRIIGSLDATSTLSGCYANEAMVVTNAGIPESFDKGPSTADGADISGLNLKNSAPMSSWDFDTDGDGDHIYWKLEAGANRPVLYVDPEEDGSFVKLGPDDGM